jgi:thiol:disulfide interchange protein DsbD
LSPARLFAVVAAILTLSAVGLAARESGEILESEEVLVARGYLSMDRAVRGSSLQVAVVVDLDPEWHINAHRTTDEFMVPTELVLEPPPGMTVGRVIYPPAVERKLEFSDQALAVYEGRIVIHASVSVFPEAPLGEGALRAVLSYQACNDENCLPPAEVAVAIPVEIVPAGTEAASLHPEIFASLPLDPQEGAGAERGLARIVRERGLLVALLIVFGWGLSLNLTPCVYPMIPLTVGYFGAQAGGRMSSRLGLAFAYFLGIALMYSTLGVIAAATGGLFGAALQNPIVLGVVAAILVALSLNMFLMRAGGGARQGALGALVMGLTVGIVAAPCVGAVVAALLIYVAEMGDLFLGFLFFFALACGLGVPFLFLAVFSSSISSLPRSGEWMNWVKRLFGVVLIGMAIYFLRPIIPVGIRHYLLPLTVVVGGVYLGFINRTQSTSRVFKWIKIGVGIVGVLMAFWLLMPRAHVEGLAWEPYAASTLEDSIAGGRPVIIDFTADWCIPCHEMENQTFRDPRVVGRSEDFRFLRVDLTRTQGPEERALKERYGVVGVPTLLFLDGGGREVRELRAVGFVEADDLLARMDALSGKRR